jgi:hypothetical protein
VVEEEVGDRRTGREHREPESHETRLLGADPHHHDEQREKQQARTEVLLADHEDHAESPRTEQRQKVAWLGQQKTSDLPRATTDQLAAFGEVCGEEESESQFRELTGLEVDWSDAHPDARSTRRESESGNHGKQQQTRTDGEEDPFEAHEIVHPSNDDQRQCERGHSDERPGGLQASETIGKAGDHHVAETVEKDCEG